MPEVLIAIAGGVGDLVRMTPLIRVCGALGFEVDLLLSPDYGDADALVGEAPEVRAVYREPSRWTGAGGRDVDGLERRHYDVAISGALAEPRAPIRAARMLRFDRAQWLRDGDYACVRTIATALGWKRPMPPPFVIPSARRFDVPPGTIAVHPGCKRTWAWKKWHGFDALAAHFPSVAIVGTPEDLDNSATYFQRPFAWPAHARHFVGSLGLADTAALLSECAALVSNDSGLMHVGAALGIPTFGIFGITSYVREALPLPNMFPITKGLPCEPACRRDRWGRRDCAFHLACLRSLTPAEVVARMERAVSA